MQIFNRSLPPSLLFAIGIILAGAGVASAQTYSISGAVTGQDGAETEPLPGASVVLLSLPDSAMVRGTATGPEGNFTLPGIEPGEYALSVSYIGYMRHTHPVSVVDGNVTGLDIRLRVDAVQIGEIDITARRSRVEISGDTTMYNADAYQTRPDASAEDLVTRMPGITIEDGRVQAQGEEVRRVLVDGNEFFGDDATATLRNLPAEIIDQIAVFDQMSDQAQFTGFDDGNRQRVIDIRTRRGMNNGRFGRTTSGYGSDNRYIGGGNVNFFEGPRRISIVGMGNNVNQQNFSTEDLLGISQAAQGGGGRGSGMRGGGGMRGRFGGPGGGGGGPWMRGPASDFMVGQQSGVSSVYSLGLNYIDQWGDDWRVNGSYFFNMTDNVNDQNLERRYLTGFTADHLYHEDALTTSDNFNHRINMRMEYTIDENRSLIITPRLSYQRNESASSMDAFTLDEQGLLLNNILSANESDNVGWVLQNNLLYRHRFATPGRTFSANLRTNLDDRAGDRFQRDEADFFDESSSNFQNDRETEVFTGGYTVAGDFSWTEPVTERTQLMLSYQPSINRNTSIQDAFVIDQMTGEYALLDTSLSNRYRNVVTTQRAQAGYRLRGDRYNADVRLAFQHTALDGRQTFPNVVETNQTWRNLLPGASLMYRFSPTSNARIAYDARTRTPSARQLQDVIDDANPLRLTTGNPDLRQQFDHNVSLRFRTTNPERATSTMAFVMAGYTRDYIGSRTFIAPRDTVLQNGITLGRGARLVTSDNLGDAFNARSFFVRSMPVDLLRSNLNLNAGLSYGRTPSISNDIRTVSDNVGFNAGLTVSSNISPNVDFRIGYQAGYNMVTNSAAAELDGNYYSGRATGAFNVILGNGIVLGSDVNLRHFEGLGTGFNQNTVYWNGSLGYRFGQNDAMEVRLTALDILNQNDNINRMILDDYIEDYRSNVLGRYFMLTLNYNFRSFAGGR